MIETHGKVEEEGKEYTMLEQVWGFNEMSKYGTKDEAEYLQQLDDMNRLELESHARRVGVVCIDSSVRLKEKLVNEFNKYYTYLQKPVVNKQPVDKSVEAQVRRLLA